jgi:hypothetical protein
MSAMVGTDEEFGSPMGSGNETTAIMDAEEPFSGLQYQVHLEFLQ